jgi:hypothetical protein
MTLNKWSEARTLADLGVLTAAWLEDKLPGDHPNGYDRPDEETLPLVPSLAAACRAGFVTVNSQPGCVETFEGQLLEQRAWVEGLADTALCERIAGLAEARGLRVFVSRASDPDSPVGFAATLVDGARYDEDGYAYCQVGLRQEPEYVAVCWEGCSEDAVTAAVGAWQVTVVDPEVGRNDVLWPVLAEAIQSAEAVSP